MTEGGAQAQGGSGHGKVDGRKGKERDRTPDGTEVSVSNGSELSGAKRTRKGKERHRTPDGTEKSVCVEARTEVNSHSAQCTLMSPNQES